MARIASEYTLACRKLFQENPELSYSEALPKLKDEGYDVPDDPGEKSADLKLFEKESKKLDVERTLQRLLRREDDKEFDAVTKKVKTALGWNNNARFNAAVEQWKIHDKFRRERANFDVIRSQWKKRHSPSAKPSTSEGRKAKAARLLENNGDFSSKFEIVKAVMQEGGIAAIRKRLEELEMEKTDLETKLAVCEEVGDLLTEAA